MSVSPRSPPPASSPPGGANKKLGPDLWLAARNGEFDKVKSLVERGAPVNFKHVSRKPKLRAYPLSVAVFRNRFEIVEFLLGRGADPLLRNYRKETCFDIARQAGLTDMLALLERWRRRGGTVAADAESEKNRERDIKNVRKLEMDERPDISRAEIAALVKQSSAFDAQIRAREEEALRRKEAAIRERKERERQEKEEEERVYLASLAGAGENERARAAALEAREAQRRAHASQRAAWEAERRREEEEGAAALAELQRRRDAAQRGQADEEAEERRAREQYEAKEREAVQRALQLKARQQHGGGEEKEKEKPKDKSPRIVAALSTEDEWAALAAAVEANIETHEGDEDEENGEAPPPALPPPPAWDSGEDEDEDQEDAEEAAARFLEEKQKKKQAEAKAEKRNREAEAEKKKREAEAERKRAEEEAEERKRAEEAERKRAERKKDDAGAASVVRSKYAYKATRDDELSFKKGEQITIVSLDPKGKWHLGRLESGATGKFPANYV